MDDNSTVYTNSIFEQPWWLDIVACGKWLEIVAEKNNEVVGRLPIVCEKGNIVMPPLTQTCGIWMKDIPQGKGNDHLVEISEKSGGLKTGYKAVDWI